MQKLLPVFIISLLFLTACQTQDNIEAISSISKSLDKSNEIIIESNDLVYRRLDNKLKDPQSQAKAILWSPKAFAVKALSNDVNKYIKSLKKQLAGVQKNDGSTVRELFRKEGGSLYNKLARYNIEVVKTINPDRFNDWPSFKTHLIKDVESFKKDIANRSGILVDSLTGIHGNDQKWQKKYLDPSSQLLGMAFLNKIQNDVLVTENSLISYMDMQTESLVESFDVFHALAVLSSSYIKVGQEIEVTAGIGALSAASNPTITINGSVVKVDETGAAIYKLKTNQKPGKYHVPVRIEFTKPDGSTAFVNKKFEYIIAE